MKTGEFAKKYNLTPNGVRFYVSQGLICPIQTSKQYVFDRACEIDMEYIIKLKKLGFSLAEICRIFYIKKFIEHTTDKKVNQSFIDLFEVKKAEILKEIDELHNSIYAIEEETTRIEQNIQKVETDKYGLSLAFLNYLSCPKCGGSLKISNAVLENNSIFQGKLLCSCGYNAIVEDGILLGSQKLDTRLEWSSPVSIAFEPTAQYIGMESKAYNWIKLQLREIKYEDKVFFSSGGYAGNFICENANLFAEGSYFILADRYINTIRNIRDKLGELNAKFNILYICDDLFELPLKDKCIDIFLDDYSSSEYIFFDSCYPINKIEKLLSNQAYIVGIFNYYQKHAKTLKQIKSEYSSADISKFLIETFRYQLNQSKLEMINSETIGAVKNLGSGDSFDYHIYGDSLYFYTYFAQRKRNNE